MPRSPGGTRKAQENDKHIWPRRALIWPHPRGQLVGGPLRAWANCLTCRPPPSWDRVLRFSASFMGPPDLAVVGPPGVLRCVVLDVLVDFPRRTWTLRTGLQLQVKTCQQWSVSEASCDGPSRELVHLGRPHPVQDHGGRMAAAMAGSPGAVEADHDGPLRRHSQAADPAAKGPLRPPRCCLPPSQRLSATDG